MSSAQLRSVIGQFRRLLSRDGSSSLTDGQLLAEFVNCRDEASFEVLVWRHGVMVLNVCQRVLRDSHLAEDAFQAVFLIFARKASSVREHESVGGWLARVAYRTALRLKARSAREPSGEEDLSELPERSSADDLVWRDLRPVLDEEIDRLPEKFRVPFVLCYLQGHTNEEAAQQLGCPKGTVLSRLARGRERLRSRLLQRGVTLSAGWLAASLGPGASAAQAPAMLVGTTVKAAISFAAGQPAVGLVSAAAAALTEGVLHTMYLTKLKLLAAAVALACLVPGTGLVVHNALAERPRKPETPAARGGERKPAVAPREASKPADHAGKIVAAGADGKSITLELPFKDRTAPPERIQLALDDKTAVTYFNVGADGAKPTEGQQAQVWLAAGSKELAARALVRGDAKDIIRRNADLQGRVTKVSPDRKALTFHFPAQGRGEKAVPEKDVEVQMTDKTIVSYSYVDKGGAKPAEGYQADVWFVRGSKDIADRVAFMGTGERPPRVIVENDPKYTGRIVAAAADGKSFTVETPAKGRGETAGKHEVKIDDKTKIFWRNVGPDGDKPAKDYLVQVWLVDGSPDVAFKINFMGTAREREIPTVAGKVLAVAADGKSLTIETPPPRDVRGGAAKKVEVKLTDKTNLLYNGVGPGGAKPTVGYLASAVLEDGSMDTAVQVYLSSPDVRRGR